jgi:putative spermidine/putrescine transport system permease protein
MSAANWWRIDEAEPAGNNAMAIISPDGRRPWTFYLLGAIFAVYVVFLYAPMACIYILSFQGSQGGLGFPMRGFSLHWFDQLLTQGDTGDLMGAISRSLPLALLVMALTVAISFAAGMAFRSRFFGSLPLFYLVIASLVAPGYVLGIGIGLMFQMLGWDTDWYTSALGAQLSWTLPFGLLIMFAVFGRFSRSYEEASRDLGAGPLQTLRLVVIPMLLPGVIAVALFGFTLSYDEFARTLQTVGSNNTVPIEIWSMTQNVTSPSIYALGTLTTGLSFVVILLALGSIALIQRRRLGPALTN